MKTTTSEENTEINWIDNCFRVEQKKWGTWESYDKDGNGIITSLEKEACIHSTRWYLKSKQEKLINENHSKYEGTVGGKL